MLHYCLRSHINLEENPKFYSKDHLLGPMLHYLLLKGMLHIYPAYDTGQTQLIQVSAICKPLTINYKMWRFYWNSTLPSETVAIQNKFLTVFQACTIFDVGFDFIIFVFSFPLSGSQLYLLFVLSLSISRCPCHNLQNLIFRGWKTR